MIAPAVAPLGSEQNPVKLALAPASDTPKVLAAILPLTKLLEQETGLRFKLSTPTSHAATVEALGTTNVDVAWLAPLGYLLARERVGVEPLLVAVRDGSTTSMRLPVPLETIANAPPDARQQVRALVRTEPVPNDTIAVRKGVPAAVTAKLRDGLLRVAASPDGARLLHDLYGIDGLSPVTDAAFGSLRTTVTLLGLNLDEALAPRRGGS
ncbi:MAG: PhnD/SsuA/transferrin family substrate-binding protein [Chloroflexota bacterium]